MRQASERSILTLRRGYEVRGRVVELSSGAVDLLMPVSREGTWHVPNALAGTTFQIGRFGGKLIVIERWDGQPFELQ